MPENRDDELIKIKKKKAKPKREKPRKENKKREKRSTRPKVNAIPRAKGVKLDFTEEAPEVNRYYMGISSRYRIARYATIVLLCVFLFVMLAFYRENITYANLMYLVRDLDSSGQVSVGIYNDITYDRSFVSDFELFRSRIAQASPTGFTLYSAAGTVDLESEGIIAEPRLEVGEKYAVMYGVGEKDYSVYTTIAKVLSGECEFEIEDCAVADSGRYAILTEDDEARFLITVYSESFKSLLKYHMNDFVVDMALDSEGENIAVASAVIDSSAVKCELMLGSIDNKDSKYIELEGMMPICCEYTDDNRLFLLCDSALIIFEGEKEVARISFGGLTPGFFDIEGNVIALTFPENVMGNENSLSVYDTEGKELVSEKISSKVLAVATDGEEAVYAVGEAEVFRLSFGDKAIEKEPLKVRALSAIAVPGSLVVFSPDGSDSYFTGE